MNGNAKLSEVRKILSIIMTENAYYRQFFWTKRKNKEEKSSSNKSNEEYKVMSIIENGKVIKWKKINIRESLSELRSQLELPIKASFLNDGADIDIKEDSIYIKREESKQYTIYYNNQILTKQNLEPINKIASLRNLLSFQINDKAYFINANIKEKINSEEEEFLLL